MSLTVEWEPLSALLSSGLEDLAIAHWEEAEIDKEDVPLALDLERAFAFEKAGQYKTAALRRDTSLVGYATFTIMPPIFHRNTLHAFCSAVYVDPAHRGFASLWLLRWCEEALTGLGVRKIYIAAKTDRLRELLAKLGYVVSETSHCKVVGGRRVQRSASPHSVPALESSGR